MEWETIDESLFKIAQRFKKIRKVKSVNQKELSKMSNVSLGSIKRFEQTGQISLYSLFKLCESLDIKYEMTNLFEEIPYTNIQQIIKNEKRN